MTDKEKEKLHQILSSLWKNDDSVGKMCYNQALQDVQIAIDTTQEESVDYDKLNTMLDDALSKETNDSWNERFDKNEEPVSEGYQPWQLIMACNIMKSAFSKCQENGTIPFNLGLECPIGAIESYLMNKVVKELGVKPLKQCSIEELEEEINKRRNGNNKK